ncbi:hypothetical protein [Crossiella sp. CA198]|uniref:hypothetical protein n=1 Tax=Crossiella sp. CA198 TaxID=3455607 RepID=UPI003F8D8F22
MTKVKTVARLTAITLGAAAIGVLPSLSAAAAPAEGPGTYSLRKVSAEGATGQFQVTFNQPYQLAVSNGHLQVKNTAGKVLDDVAPSLKLASGRTVTGEFAVQPGGKFSFTVTGAMPRFTWGGFWCGMAATISGAVGGAFIGGPIGAGFGLGTGIAAAATC